MDVRESGRRVTRYQVVSFTSMRLLGGWLAKIPEYELKLEIGRHVWQDAQAAESLRVRSGELRVPADADRRPPVELQRWLDSLDQAKTPLQFLVGIYRVAKPRLVGAMVQHMESTDPVCDAPTLRTVRPIIQELGEQINWGEAAIAAVCAGNLVLAAESAARQAHLEASLAEAGGLLVEGTPQPAEPEGTVEAGKQSLNRLQAARTPRSERLLIAAREVLSS